MPAPCYVCPKCGRQFARRPIEHTCERLSIATHLQGKDPGVQALYKRILALVKSHGPVQVAALKTTIALSAPAIMGYITLQKKALKLTLLLIGERHHPTLRKRVPMSTMKLAHEFVFTTDKDLDDDIQSMVREAWELAQPD